jgi:hypothetical protein
VAYAQVAFCSWFPYFISATLDLSKQSLPTMEPLQLMSILAGPSCIPTTCAALGKTCGAWGDGCGSTLDCGPSCTGESSCLPPIMRFRCVCATAAAFHLLRSLLRNFCGYSQTVPPISPAPLPARLAAPFRMAAVVPRPVAPPVDGPPVTSDRLRHAMVRSSLTSPVDVVCHCYKLVPTKIIAQCAQCLYQPARAAPPQNLFNIFHTPHLKYGTIWDTCANSLICHTSC